MDDYIKRENALDIVADNNVHGEITLNRYDKIIDGIYEIPSADVVQVVRCENCERMEIQGRTTQFCFCKKWYSPVNPDGFCSFAERKDNETI